jgi:predicted esterase
MEFLSPDFPSREGIRRSVAEMAEILKKIAFVAWAVLAVRPVFPQDFERATIIDKVLCRADERQSYALYLPSAFDRERTWPVLVLFDPGARGPAGIRAFREAAEAYGWILAGSNDSRNGPWEVSVRAAGALWKDIQERLPIDQRRVYAAGFSGGARVASIFPRILGRPIAGVIGCGAGLASEVEPRTLGAAAYFGLTGLADFNYGEMKGLDEAFEPSGVPHRFEYFEGVHDWPDPASCARAVAWMEVTAMKQRLRPTDPRKVGAWLAGEIAEADALEREGRIFWAVDRLEAVVRLAEGMDLDMAGLAGLAGRVAELKARKEYGRFLEAERKRDKRAVEFREEFGRAFGAVEEFGTSGARTVPKVLRETGITFLRREAKGKGSIEDRALASRLLFDFCFAARTRALKLYGQRDFRRAGAYFDLAIAACEEGLAIEGYLHYERSCVAVLAGDKALALRHLAVAVDRGFADIGRLESDKDLDPIRDTTAFRDILERVKKSGETRK